MEIKQISQNTNFKSGLAQSALNLEKKISIDGANKYFQKSKYKDHGDFFQLDFKNNKAYAAASILCSKIFAELRKKYDYRAGFSAQELLMPAGIYVWNDGELDKKFQRGAAEYSTLNFDNKSVTSNYSYFRANTILIQNRHQSLEELNAEMEKQKEKNHLSTSHFLHCPIHEWIHALQGKFIENLTKGLGLGTFETTVNVNLKSSVNDKENEVVRDVLGEYAADRGSNQMQYAEIFAEAWTKFICNSLDEDCVHFKKDPIDELNKTPREFREILKKVSALKTCGSLGVNGKFIQYSWGKNWDKK